MQKRQGFADNGACPVDPACGETCRKKCKLLSEIGQKLHFFASFCPISIFVLKRFVPL